MASSRIMVLPASHRLSAAKHLSLRNGRISLGMSGLVMMAATTKWLSSKEDYFYKYLKELIFFVF